jgi:meiotically up-regulated gene 157 (Mug157) protein
MSTSLQMPTFASQRPPVSERRFTNAAVESLITEVAGSIADPELAWLFANCLPNTLDTTIDHRIDANGRPDTYVITGDIDAMWLRDSAAQVWPYLPLARTDAALRTLIAGVIRRQADGILLDPYANAFYRDPVLGYWKTDLTQMLPGVHERKWELDSLAYFLRLSHAYWTVTGDLSPFDDMWRRAVTSVFALIRVEQSVGDDPSRSPYSFQRMAGTHLGSHSSKVHTPNCGLIRCSFRPSDDMVKLPFLVPANAMIAVALRDTAALLAALHLDALAAEAHAQSDTITHALEKHGVVNHPVHGEIWAYEIDGYGDVHLMDDSNVPSLLSLPYLGFLRARRRPLPTHPRFLPERRQSPFRLRLRRFRYRQPAHRTQHDLAHVALHAGAHREGRQRNPRLPSPAQVHACWHRLYARVVQRGRSPQFHPSVVRVGEHALRRTHCHSPP